MLILETGRRRVFIQDLASELRLLRPVSSCHQLIEHARLPCGGVTWTRGGFHRYVCTCKRASHCRCQVCISWNKFISMMYIYSHQSCYDILKLPSQT